MCTFWNTVKIDHIPDHKTGSNKCQRTENHREYVLWPQFN